MTHRALVSHALRMQAVCAVLAIGAGIAAAQSPRVAGRGNGNWPCFRGPDRLGIAPAGNDAIPLEWSDTRNIVWKAELPGRGASSPIIWGDNIYVTAYTGCGLVKGSTTERMKDLARHLLCVDRRTGKVRWKADQPVGDRLEHGPGDAILLHGYASSAPVADESGVYVYYGTMGVIAYDHAGRQRWHAPLGKSTHGFGSASSPILFENLVIMQADIEAKAMVALEKQTGREAWRVETGTGDTWSTPLVMEANGRKELVFHHSKGHPSGKFAAVDPRTGAALWECDVLKDYLCPSPVAQNGVIYLLGYSRGAAVRAGGRGDVTASHVLWTTTRGAETCTLIVHGGHVYWTHQESGIAHCLDAKTGEVVYQERITPAMGKAYASGVLVGDRIYYVSRENGTFVVEAKPRFKLLAHNRMPSDSSIFNGTPAISAGQLFLRSDQFLYCIGTR